jgi:hypothetical protein
MGLLRSVAAVVLILAAQSACGGGEGAASDGVLHGNSGTTTSSGGARLLFSSGFEGSIALSAPSLYGNGAWQDIVGTDSTTGSTWPGNIWGGGIRLQMIVDAPVNATTLGNYMVNRIETVTGRDGKPTKALYSELKQRGGDHTQDVLMLQPAREEGDMYISFWLKLQPDLLERMTPQNWRMVFEWKTGGDYRVKVEIVSWEGGCRGVKPNGPLYWQIRGDNVANGGLPYQGFWKVENCSHPVPVDEWFKFEIFWHRSHLSDGRVWMAVNGQVIFDRYEPNIGVSNAPIDRIMMPNLYSDTPYPVDHWIDDVEIWSGFPPVGNNPPYAPH